MKQRLITAVIALIVAGALGLVFWFLFEATRSVPV